MLGFERKWTRIENIDVPSDWFGFGYVIVCWEGLYGNGRDYVIFHAEDCEISFNNYYGRYELDDNPRKENRVRMFDRISDAKKWCKEHSR